MIWWLTSSLGDVPAGDAWLGAAERSALARLAIEKRRSDWRLGRYTAKRALCAWLGVEPTRVEVLAAESGAPVVRVDGRLADVELSISHRAGRALVVLASPCSPVGCDLELIEPRSAAFVDEWLAPSEQALVRSTPKNEQAWLINLVWSAKEAATKARGEGLRLDVRRAEVVFGGPPRGEERWLPLRVDWGSEQDHGWYRREPEWVMTVVGRDRGQTGAPMHCPRARSEQQLDGRDPELGAPASVLYGVPTAGAGS